MEVGFVQKIDIDNEMQQAYLDYAMSVIIARALPDARDGLKPVHRRILYAMHDMGLRQDSAYKKSARIVGEVLGKYHPHGDEAVYDAMARMAQDFSMRYMLVDGQGNFGSVDGDPPAAMRYTEARLASIATHMLVDIEKQTVDFEANFDGTLEQPSVLPAAIPNLLVNGATGIAVGMATSIPPHNLREVIDALQYMLAHWEKLDDLSIDDLLSFIQGPDFPTGGIIIQDSEGDGLKAAYSTGRGRVTVQASAHLEEMERGRNRIIVTELPFMTNKSSLIERIASLVRDEKLVGIVDLRDESDRQGMRIVIDLSKTADPESVLADLYKSTPMQSTFSIIMLALVEGEPRLLGLKQVLRVYLDHRLEIIRRRSIFELEKARQRGHILEGLLVALRNLDEVIDLIRKSPNAEAARDRLMKRFKLSELQAQAILDMPLRRLAALERKKIEDEYKAIQALIRELETLLRSPKKIRQEVSAELQVIKDTFGDRRKTHIVSLKGGKQQRSTLTTTQLAPDQIVWITVTGDGKIARTHDGHQPQLDNGSMVEWMIQASMRDTLYLVDRNGQAASLAVHALQEAESPEDGLAITKASALRGEVNLAAVFTQPPKERREKGTSENAGAPDQKFVLTCTTQGLIKKSSVNELPGPSATTFTLVKVNEGDRLGWLAITVGKQEILLGTAMGMAIRFPESDVRPMGMVAAGVLGIKLAQGDEVIGMLLIPHPGDLLFVSQDGMGKRVKWDQFPSQGRYGQGVIAWKLPGSVRLVAMLAGIPSTKISLLFEHHTPKTIRFDKVALLGRTAKGQSIIDLPIRERIVRISQAQTAAQGMQDVPAKGRRRTSRTGDTAQPTVPARQRRVTTPKSEPNTQATQIRLPEPATTPPAKSTSRSSKSSTLESTSPTTADKKPGTRSTTRQSSQNPEPSVKPSKPKGTVNKEPVSKTTAPKSDAEQNIDQGAPGRKRGRPPKKQNP